jgi:hypothetical protein
MLDEAAIRTALMKRVQARWELSSQTLMIEEFGTHLGASRIDLAVVNGHLWGYEIKSAADRLNRLPAQVNAYSEVFDYVGLVAADQHLDRAVLMVPDWWEIIRATSTNRGTRLVQVVRGRRNRSTQGGAIARLLWRDELASVLRQTGNDAGVRSATRDRLADRLVESLSRDELGRIVRDQIRARPAWRDARARTPDDAPFLPARMSSDFLARRLRPLHR